MRKLITTFTCVILLASVSVAQDLSIVMRTSRLMGDSVKLSVVAGGTNQILVDWGDQISIPYTVSGNVNSPTLIHKPIQADSAVIRVYVDGSAITYLTCIENDLISLDLTRGNGLRYLRCYTNKLKEINVSSHTGLLLFHCYTNEFTSLDVTSNTALTDLQLHNNFLTTLNLTGLTALKTLVTTNNPLESLDVSTNIALTTLNVRNSKLTMLDVSKNVNLTKIDLFNSTNADPAMANHFDACLLDAFYTTLPNKTVAANLLVNNDLYNPNKDKPDNDVAGSNKTLATAKGWTVKSYQNELFTGDGGGCATGIFNLKADPQFDIYPNPTVDFINIRYTDNVDKHRMLITDLTGKVCLDHVMNGQDVTVELTGFAKGVYLIYTADTVRKLMIE